MTWAMRGTETRAITMECPLPHDCHVLGHLILHEHEINQLIYKLFGKIFSYSNRELTRMGGHVGGEGYYGKGQ